MSNVGLLYVGAILFINGLSLLGHIPAKAAAPLNFFVGFLQVFTPIFIIVNAVTAHDSDPALIAGASGLFLFGFTYLWVGLNSVTGWSGEGLGWFSLFVAGCAVVYAAYSGFTSKDWAFAIIWILWGILWFMFFLLLGLGKEKTAHLTGYIAAGEGLITAAIPALLMLTGHWDTTAPYVIGVGVAAILLLVLAAPLSKLFAKRAAA